MTSLSYTTKRGSKKMDPHERIKQLEHAVVKFEAEEELLAERENFIDGATKSKRLKTVRDRINRIYAEIGTQKWIIAQRGLKEPESSRASS